MSAAMFNCCSTMPCMPSASTGGGPAVAGHQAESARSTCGLGMASAAPSCGSNLGDSWTVRRLRRIVSPSCPVVRGRRGRAPRVLRNSAPRESTHSALQSRPVTRLSLALDSRSFSSPRMEDLLVVRRCSSAPSRTTSRHSLPVVRPGVCRSLPSLRSSFFSLDTTSRSRSISTSRCTRSRSAWSSAFCRCCSSILRCRASSACRARSCFHSCCCRLRRSASSSTATDATTATTAVSTGCDASVGSDPR
mmetsp:Transcript_49910/g.132643  ORF Transcript_49910/g.132643 Transcript_49910/m.132643 type:complete len:249 (+) Transcript_49910:1756-2502(+)